MRVLSGEQARKMEAIWEKYYGTMLAEAKKILIDTALAEDAVSEAFLKMMKYIEKLGEVSSYQTRSYIVKIVRSVSIDLYKKRKSRNEDSDEALEFAKDKDTDILAELLTTENISAIKEAIKAMSASERDVINLNLIEGYSHAEIAKMLGITEAASKMRLHRAKRAIIKHLGGEYYDK